MSPSSMRITEESEESLIQAMQDSGISDHLKEVYQRQAKMTEAMDVDTQEESSSTPASAEPTLPRLLPPPPTKQVASSGDKVPLPYYIDTDGRKIYPASSWPKRQKPKKREPTKLINDHYLDEQRERLLSWSDPVEGKPKALWTQYQLREEERITRALKGNLANEPLRPRGDSASSLSSSASTPSRWTKFSGPYFIMHGADEPTPKCGIDYLRNGSPPPEDPQTPRKPRSNEEACQSYWPASSPMTSTNSSSSFQFSKSYSSGTTYSFKPDPMTPKKHKESQREEVDVDMADAPVPEHKTDPSTPSRKKVQFAAEHPQSQGRFVPSTPSRLRQEEKEYSTPLRLMPPRKVSSPPRPSFHIPLRPASHRSVPPTPTKASTPPPPTREAPLPPGILKRHRMDSNMDFTDIPSHNPPDLETRPIAAIKTAPNTTGNGRQGNQQTGVTTPGPAVRFPGVVVQPNEAKERREAKRPRTTETTPGQISNRVLAWLAKKGKGKKRMKADEVRYVEGQGMEPMEKRENVYQG